MIWSRFLSLSLLFWNVGEFLNWQIIVLVAVLGHGLSFVEEILTIFHEINLFDEQIGLFVAEILLTKELRCRWFELVVGSLNFFDVNLLFLVHFLEPVMHNLLLLLLHRSQWVEEIPCPHNLRVHDDLVYQMVGVRNQRVVDPSLIRSRLALTSFWGWISLDSCSCLALHLLVGETISTKIIQQKLQLLVNTEFGLILIRAFLTPFLHFCWSSFSIRLGDHSWSLR